MILDVCCGSRMFWFDKNNPNVTFCDNRKEEHILCDGRTLKIDPNVQCDFRCLPFDNNTYKLVVFDPPHLVNAGKESYMGKKYGILNNTWQDDLRRGFAECFRVLEPFGVLVFKWSEPQIKLSEILKLTEHEPLFGHKSGRLNNTHWLCFAKMEKGANEG